MALLIWGVKTGRLLSRDQTKENMIEGMIDKMK
jgi:hypothetical protein